MIGRVLCIFTGIALALLVGSSVLVLFVYSPMELLEADGGRAIEAGLLTLEAARHAAVLAAPLALIAAVAGVWRRWAGPTYYVLSGMGIAAIGYATEQTREAAAAAVEAYALTAFLTAGFAAGLVYWLVAGRLAKGRQRHGGSAEARPPKRPAPGMPEGAA